MRFAGTQNEDAAILDTSSCDSSTQKKFTEVFVKTHVVYRQYNELRKKYRVQLLRSVDITEGLLADLATIEAFEIKVSNIRTAIDQEAKADMILSLPSENNYEQNIGPFLNVLRENGHAHVANVFITGSGEDLMTDDTYQLLSSNLDNLCNYLDPECSIISMLRSKDVLTESDEARVMVHKTANGQVDQILNILSHKSNCSYQQFIDSLKEKDQEHIVYILTEGREGHPPISKTDLQRIKDKRLDIVDNMDSVGTVLISSLVTSGVFTNIDMQRVESKNKCQYKRNEQILNILVRKSRPHFERFIKALNETDQEHVASLFASTITGTVNVGDQFAERSLEQAIRRDVADEDSEMREHLGRMGIPDYHVSSGSIRIWFRLFTTETLDLMQSGKLDSIFTERYRDKSLESIRVDIPETEFEKCRKLIDERKELMKPEYKKALELAAERIADRITVDKLLHALSLCKYRRDVILCQGSEEDKARVLLQVMARRPDCEFQILVNALRRTEQDYAANFITSKF